MDFVPLSNIAHWINFLLCVCYYCSHCLIGLLRTAVWARECAARAQVLIPTLFSSGSGCLPFLTTWTECPNPARLCTIEIFVEQLTTDFGPGTVVHTFSPSAQQAETGLFAFVLQNNKTVSKKKTKDLVLFNSLPKTMFALFGGRHLNSSSVMYVIATRVSEG